MNADDYLREAINDTTTKVPLGTMTVPLLKDVPESIRKMCREFDPHYEPVIMMPPTSGKSTASRLMSHVLENKYLTGHADVISEESWLAALDLIWGRFKVWPMPWPRLSYEPKRPLPLMPTLAKLV